MKLFWVNDFDISRPKSGLEIPPYYLKKELKARGLFIDSVQFDRDKDSLCSSMDTVYIVDFVLNRKLENDFYKRIKETRNILIRYSRDCHFVQKLSLLKNKFHRATPHRTSSIIKTYVKELIISSRRYDAFVFVNERDARAFSRIFPWTRKRCFVVPNGVDLDTFYADYESVSEKREILFVGPSDYEPNYLAVSYISREIVPVFKEETGLIFEVVGKGWKNKELVCASENFVINDFVDDIGKTYRKAWVFLAPIFVGSGIKNKVLEAMASGLPVVGTKEAFSGIGVEHMKHGIVCETKDEFINAIRILINDKNLYNKISTEARSLIEREFSWTKSATKLLGVIDLIKERKHFG